MEDLLNVGLSTVRDERSRRFQTLLLPLRSFATGPTAKAKQRCSRNGRDSLTKRIMNFRFIMFYYGHII